jgi:DNA-binding NarL/FixJ family response regulator
LKKLVIVDDGVLVRERLRSMVSDLNLYRIVGEAENPGDALALLEREEPDVMILDMRLTGGTGMEVLQEIRRRGLDVLVMVWTNYPYERYRAVCRAMGAGYFFSKTNEYDRLIEALRIEGTSLEASTPGERDEHDVQ